MDMQRDTYCLEAMARAMLGEADLLGAVDYALRAEVAEAVEFRLTRYAWVPATAAKAAGAQPAAEDLNAGGWFVYSFPNNLRRQVQASIMIPAEMDRNEESVICFGWSTPANGQDLVVDFHYLITAVGDDTEAAGTSILGSVFTASAVADGLTQNQLVVLPGGTIPPNALCLHMVLERDGANVLDTLGDVMELHGVAVQYVVTGLGG